MESRTAIAPPIQDPRFTGQHPMMDPAKFYHQFEQTVIGLQEQISQLGSIAPVGGERHDATEAIQAGITNLTQQVSDASDSIPRYDQRHYGEAIKRLTEMLNEELARLHPKTRFQFQFRDPSTSSEPASDPRQLRWGPQGGVAAGTAVAGDDEDVVGALPKFGPGSGPGKNYNEEISRPGAGGIRKPSFSAARNVDIRDHEGLHIILPLTAAKATSSGSLRDLRRCIIDMSEPAAGTASFASLAIRDVSSSLVVAGNVNGAAHVTAVRDSVLVVSARQVRMHECENVRVYLYCASRPIIEDCVGMKFAPIPSCYVPQSQDPDSNQWDQVDDFKWLKTDHSPNWCVLKEEERLPETFWKQAVPGRPGHGPVDILKEAGVLAG
ncbi:hypothetical protein RB595_007169 [Gaeumannomyces hyphopodioides]